MTQDEPVGQEEEKLRELLFSLARVIGAALGPKVGFALFTFGFNEPYVDYISNGNGEDMLKALKAFIEEYSEVLSNRSKECQQESDDGNKSDV